MFYSDKISNLKPVIKYHSVWFQYCSLMIDLLDACCLYLVEEVFYQHFRFLEMLLGCMNFRRYNFFMPGLVNN